MPALASTTDIVGIYQLTSSNPQLRLDSGALGFVFDDENWPVKRIWFGFRELDYTLFVGELKYIDEEDRPFVMPGDVIRVTHRWRQNPLDRSDRALKFKARVTAARWCRRDQGEGILFTYKPDNRPQFIAHDLTSFFPVDLAEGGNLPNEWGLLAVEHVALYEERRR